jgi:CubicO group peptidase (beta-lactamase class C family)
MKRVFAILLSALLVLSTAGCTAPTLQPTETVPPTTQPEVEVITDEIRAQWDAILEENKYEGIVYLTHNGEVVYQSVTGTNDLGEPLTADSPVFICSVSKQFCAAAILMLRDQGKLSLDDTLDKYFPECPHGEKVTLRHLLTMRSGLAWDFDLALVDPDQYTDKTGEEVRDILVDWVLTEPLLFEPDTDFAYCNVNALLLSLVVEQVSGECYEDFIRQNFLEPLGMNHTGFMNEVESNPQWGLIIEREYERSDIVQGAGDMVSSAADMDRWMTALGSGQVICEESYLEMTTDYTPGPMINYGYCMQGGPGTGWGHGGANIKQYTGYCYFNRDYGYNLFVFTGQTPSYFPQQSDTVKTEILRVLLRALDAAAQAQ